MKKAFITTGPLESPRKYDQFVWFKDNTWCSGYVLEEEFENKTRVSVNDIEFETHTNTLKILYLTGSDLKPLIKLHPMDWKVAIEKDLINKDIDVDFSVGEEYYCSYPNNCECKRLGNVVIKKCDLSYKNAIASITGIIDKDYSELEALQFTMYMAMNYSEVLNQENIFWYKKRFREWLKTEKPVNVK